ncbi:MAG: hypothetical protein WCK55_19810 [Verrucomicrobiota bacterium]
MRHGDVMKDPFYACIVFEIERKITEGDQIAKSRGIVLTDSQVISVLTKVLGAAEGKLAQLPAASNPRDGFLVEMFGKLKKVCEGIFESEEGEDPDSAKPLATADWARALRCVIESARVRKGSVPGSRDYLDFLGPFIAQAVRR